MKRNHDVDDEDLIEKGGSSQDKFESDFIDDDLSHNEESDGEFDPQSKKYADELPDEDEEEAEYMSD